MYKNKKITSLGKNAIDRKLLHSAKINKLIMIFINFINLIFKYCKSCH